MSIEEIVWKEVSKMTKTGKAKETIHSIGVSKADVCRMRNDIIKGVENMLSKSKEFLAYSVAIRRVVDSYASILGMRLVFKNGGRIPSACRTMRETTQALGKITERLDACLKKLR